VKFKDQTIFIYSSTKYFHEQYGERDLCPFTQLSFHRENLLSLLMNAFSSSCLYREKWMSFDSQFDNPQILPKQTYIGMSFAHAAMYLQSVNHQI